jgi:hypothetical protein
MSLEARSEPMPLHHRVVSDQALVLVEASGVLTDADVLAAQEVSSATIRQLALQDLWGPHARRAFVVASDVAFGLARVFDILTEERGHELQVFTTMPEARRWLGMP